MQEHREDISRSHLSNKASMKAEIAKAAALLEAELPQRPTFGCQVVVQSGEEKDLRKLARKEEKKINKLLNKGGGGEEAGLTTNSIFVCFLFVKTH